MYAADNDDNATDVRPASGSYWTYKLIKGNYTTSKIFICSTAKGNTPGSNKYGRGIYESWSNLNINAQAENSNYPFPYPSYGLNMCFQTDLPSLAIVTSFRHMLPAWGTQKITAFKNPSDKIMNMEAYDALNYSSEKRYVGSYVVQPDRVYFPHRAQSASKVCFLDGHVGELQNNERGNVYDQTVNFKNNLKKN